MYMFMIFQERVWYFSGWIFPQIFFLLINLIKNVLSRFRKLIIEILISHSWFIFAKLLLKAKEYKLILTNHTMSLEIIQKKTINLFVSNKHTKMKIRRNTFFKPVNESIHWCLAWCHEKFSKIDSHACAHSNHIGKYR